MRSIRTKKIVISIFTIFSLAFAIVLTSAVDANAQVRVRKVSGAGNSSKIKVTKATRRKSDGNDDIKGRTIVSEPGIQRVTAEIQQSTLFAAPSSRPILPPERENGEGRDEEKRENPDAPAVSQWPLRSKSDFRRAANLNIHTLGNAFDGATLTDTGSFPPDSMGAAGPTQVIAFENGRIRTFTKAGAADGVINAHPDTFFSSVMTPVGGGVVLNFTSDPMARFDRFTGRWYITIIDVPCTNATCTATAANRLLMAVSDAASNGVITGATVWTFFQFQADPGTGFCDYPSLGIDVNALYIGCNMFSSAGSFVGTNGYVVRKSTTLGAGPITTTSFANLVAGAGAGPFSPRGADNFDLTSTEGYFVGVDNATFSTVMFRRVANPGSATPTISANISVTVPTTTSANPVTHAGNTGGNNGRLDALDDRLYQAMVRNGRLWTAHNFRVSSAGVANTAAQARNAVRWYEFQNMTTTPTVRQSGTVFDNAATLAAARQYFIPSVTVTGQGHSVLGMTMAGVVGATPAFVGRLESDTLGTMTGPPTTAAGTFGTTTANYNPPSDPGGAAGRRWGDYSFTVVDPLDDMTVWTFQEYNQALNSYAIRVGRLAAPGPPAIADGPNSGMYNVATGQASTNVTINGTSTGGSGWYDPGANLPAPALPFTHITASVSGANVTVNSVTVNSPTSITINLNTVGATLSDSAVPQTVRNLTITNPDGQVVTRAGMINLLQPSAAPADLGGRITDAAGRGVRGAIVRLVSQDGSINRIAVTSSLGYYRFSDLPTGVTYIVTPTQKRYTFSPESLVHSHVDELGELNFQGNL